MYAFQASASNVAEVVVHRLDGEFTFIKVDDFRTCMRYLALQPDPSSECLDKIGLDMETFKLLVETKFSRRITFHDETGSRMANPPLDLFDDDYHKKGSLPKTKPAPVNGLSIERVYQNSPISIHVILRTDSSRKVHCSVQDSNDKILTVDDGYINPPVDKLIIITGESTSLVKSATCW